MRTSGRAGALPACLPPWKPACLRGISWDYTPPPPPSPASPAYLYTDKSTRCVKRSLWGRSLRSGWGIIIHSTNQSTKQTIHRTNTHQSINQSHNQSINQSSKQATDQSIKNSINKSINRLSFEVSFWDSLLGFSVEISCSYLPGSVVGMLY